MTPTGRIVTVIFLEGGRPTFGPKAAELTGQFYRAMYERNYFSAEDVRRMQTPLHPAPAGSIDRVGDADERKRTISSWKSCYRSGDGCRQTGVRWRLVCRWRR